MGSRFVTPRPRGSRSVTPFRPRGSQSAIPFRVRRNQAVHSGETIRTTFVSLRKPVRRRSSTVRSPSFLASRIAALTVERDTPATVARCSIASRQSPRLAVSAAMRARTACSARVKREARAGGSLPEAAQRRRRSIKAIRARPGARARPGPVLAILRGICHASGRGSRWVRALSAVVYGARQSPRFDQGRQRLGLCLGQVPFPERLPHRGRDSRQRGARGRLRLSADLLNEHRHGPSRAAIRSRHDFPAAETRVSA